jgi:ankyrin repeat protein
MKTINLFPLLLVLMLITTGCKKEEPQPTRQGTVEDVKSPVKPVEPAQPVESLHQAVAGGDFEQIKSLISGGADVNAKDDNGNAPLHYAVILANKDIIELLIASGADVNIKDDQGRTALWWAKELKNTEVVELLLKHGANE